MKITDKPAADPAINPAADAPAPRPVPTYAKIGETPDAHLLRVFNADTGKEIKRVIEADTEKGWLVRFEVKAGHLVREGDDFVTVREKLPIRFEWSEA